MRLFPLYQALLLLSAFPSLAEASRLMSVGDRVVADGLRHRRCLARVEKLPDPDFAHLQFDRPGCGDSTQLHAVEQLDRLDLVRRFKGFSAGDSVIVKGHFGNSCVAHVRELTHDGMASLEFDAPLCADGSALFRVSALQRVRFVKESGKLSAGLKVSVPGIRDGDVCKGEIRRLTDNGLAELAFDQLTCAYGGKLYSVDQLKLVKLSAAPVKPTGELIFQRVMREIASRKKNAKHARR